MLAPGSVSRTLPLPGVTEHAKGFKNIAEALYLRDHILGQMELADASNDPAQRRARCTFVVVGAGYTGTEMAAQGQLFTRAALRRHPRIRHDELRWLLVDGASGVLPGLGPRLGVPALRILRHRGLDVRLETTVEEITDRWVRLSDGTTVPTHTLVWCVGVTPGPLTRALGLDTVKGRIVVDEFLTVPGHPHVFAAGDAAAVPDKIGQVYGDALAAAPPGFDIAAPVNVIVTDDLSDALRAAKTTIGFYIGVGDFHLDAVSRMEFEEAGRKVQELYLAGRPDEAFAAVPDELADGMCLLGPIGRIRERLELWRKSPVTTLLVVGPTSEPDLRAIRDAVLG